MNLGFIGCANDQLDIIKSDFALQIQALKDFYPIIKSALDAGYPMQNIKLGGGTALAMYYFQHRLSFDLDLFVPDGQHLDYFRPKMWIDDVANFEGRYADLAHHVGVSILVGACPIKIDILAHSMGVDSLLDKSKTLSIWPLHWKYGKYSCQQDNL